MVKEKRHIYQQLRMASTNEILAYNVSDSLTLDIATDTIHKLKKNKKLN